VESSRVPTGAVTLDSTERAIVQSVDRHNAAGLALLERLVNINSGTMNFAGVRQVGDILRGRLDSLGFTTKWVDGTPFKRAGHLVARRDGKGPRLLLIGHLDTVFEPGSPFQKFERINDSTATGPGVIDMKGGDVIMVQALSALSDAGVLDDMSITVVLDGDEEDSGSPLSLARKAIIDAAADAQIGLGLEDGDGDPKTAVIARRGASGWLLTSTGTPAHSSQIFRDAIGAGAIFESARVLNAFREELAGEKYLTFSPGAAVGGTEVTFDSTHTEGTAQGKSNIVAGEMRVSGDIRTLSPEQLARTQASMREIAGKSLPNTSSKIEFDDGYPPMAPTAGNRALLAKYDSVSRDLGFGPVGAVDPRDAGAADISFVASHLTMAMDGLGLSGSGGHTVHETADLRMFPVVTKRVAVLMWRLTRVSGR
jgi:glutamate carboxypeptidase